MPVKMTSRQRSDCAQGVIRSCSFSELIDSLEVGEGLELRTSIPFGHSARVDIRIVPEDEDRFREIASSVAQCERFCESVNEIFDDLYGPLRGGQLYLWCYPIGSALIDGTQMFLEVPRLRTSWEHRDVETAQRSLTAWLQNQASMFAKIRDRRRLMTAARRVAALEVA